MAPEPLRTVAEASGWRRTSRHAEVLEFLGRLSERTDLLRVESIGRSAEGRDIPLAVLSAGRAFDPASARAAGFPVVLVIANIHAGEVEGKEASLALARDATTGDLRRLVERAVVLLVPDYNPDGNDRIDPKNRALDLARLEGQIGPEEGVGTRTTGEGVNLNRDYVKQAAVESRALAALTASWRPHVVVDCHTTDGSVHGYDLTFDTSRNLASISPGPALHARDVLLRGVARSLRARSGRRVGFYGNFASTDDPESGWETYPPLPRYGSHYRGLLGVVDVLLEAYSYVDYRTRFEATREVLVEILDHVREHGRAVVDLVEGAAADATERGRRADPADLVGVSYGVPERGPDGSVAFRWRAEPLEDLEIEAWDLESQRRRRVPGRERRTYRNAWLARHEPTASVRRPFGYLVPASSTAAVERVRGHFLEASPLVREAAVDVEAYRVTGRDTTGSVDIATGAVPETVLQVEAFRERHRAAPGDLFVPAGQARGNLAIHLLEPSADDGLARWGFFDREAVVGATFPARRVLSPVDLPLAR
jgi:hypothetical protein